MSDFIVAKNITKTYRKGGQSITPLADVSLQVAAGEFVSLMGPSGSGKTTLLNLLGGVDHLISGELSIAGTAVHRLSRSALTKWRAQTVGYVFQLYHLIPVLTAFENVEIPLLLTSLSRRQRRQRVLAALELVGIADRHDHYPRQLSGGQEQRVAIARALVANAPLLVADEPTGDLDAEAASSVLQLLQNLSQNHQKTIIMVTHDPRAAIAASRQLHLDKGRLRDAALVS